MQQPQIYLSTIHQTKTWAKFREATKGEKKIEINAEKKYYAIIQKIPLPMGKSWLYCNRGPVFEELSENAFDEFLSKTKELARKENSVFLRIEPPYEKNKAEKYSKLCKKLGFKDAHTSHQPEVTLIIDLTKSENEILAQMKQKGRYNIRLADKKGVKIKESKDADSFYKILKETTTRDKFTPHGKDFYKKMIEILGEKDFAKMYLAEYEGETIAGIIVTFYQDTATYYYGASSNKHRNVMAPYLLQWHAIKEAKSRNMKKYDFLGISPPDAKNHPWQGVTEFKMKFGGEIVEYVKAKEFIYKPFWYWVIRIAKKLKGK